MKYPQEPGRIKCIHGVLLSEPGDVHYCDACEDNDGPHHEEVVRWEAVIDGIKIDE